MLQEILKGKRADLRAYPNAFRLWTLYALYHPRRRAELPIGFPELCLFRTDAEQTLADFRRFIEDETLQTEFLSAMRDVDKKRAAFIGDVLYDPLYLFLRRRFTENLWHQAVSEILHPQLPPRTLSRLWRLFVWGFPYPFWRSTFSHNAFRFATAAQAAAFLEGLYDYRDTPAIAVALGTAEEQTPEQRPVWAIALAHFAADGRKRTLLADLRPIVPTLIAEALRIGAENTRLHPRMRKAFDKLNKTLFNKQAAEGDAEPSLIHIAAGAPPLPASDKTTRPSPTQRLYHLAYRPQPYSLAERRWLSAKVDFGHLFAMILSNGLPSQHLLQLFEKRARRNPAQIVSNASLARGFVAYGIPLAEPNHVYSLLLEQQAPSLAALFARTFTTILGSPIDSQTESATTQTHRSHLERLP